MATGVTSWSQTAATNASSDSTVNWAEGQAPSSINDSARAVMASVAKYRDDNAGSLVTGGTSTAYTIASNQGFASKAAMNGAEISFTMHATNGASPTLNVDSLGGDPITLDGTNAVPTGTLIGSSVYTAIYYASGTAWRLKDFYQLPFSVPIGGTIDFFGTTAPNSNFVFPYGQAISRTTYSALFALVSTTFGTGDGSTTFNVPDLRGRVTAGKDDMGGSAASRLTSSWFGSDATVLGATGSSSEKNALSSTNQLPQFTPSGTISNGSVTFPNAIIASAGNGQVGAVVTNSSGVGGGNNLTSSLNATQGSSTFSGNAIGSGSPSSFRTVQPTIICNKLLRII
jgi:microcystin-dependent protein